MTRNAQSNLRGQQRQRLAAALAERFRREGTPIQELAASVNRRPATVRRLLDEAGIRTDGPLLVGTSQQDAAAALAERYRGGTSIAALARDTGIDWRVIRQLLVDAGVELPNRGSQPCMSADELAERYRAGASIRSLAELTHSSYRTVRALLLAAGVTLRQRGQRPAQPNAPANDSLR